MTSSGIKPDVISYSAAISACEKGSQWEKALGLLQDMTCRGIKPDVISYSAAISACEKGSQWEKALGLLQDMTCRGIKPDVISYSAAISTCEKGSQWEKALGLLQEMTSHGIKPDVISYNAAISACEKGSQSEKALDLLQEMTKNGIEPDLISYSAAIEACFVAQKYSEALSLCRRAQRSGLYPVFPVRRSLIWHLHSLSLAVACTLLTDSLLQVVREESFDEPSFRNIAVITGRGLGSGPYGPVLRSGVPRFLQETSGPEIVFDGKNEGRFHLTRNSLQIWVESGKSNKFRHRFDGEERI